MSLYLHNLILEGEHQKLDFKFEISDAKKIARTFSSFANTDGGRLLIGVKDNGNISGVKSDEEEYMAEAAAHLYCKPPVNYSVTHHTVNEKTVLEVIIPESPDKPHKAPWKDGSYKAFVRVDDQNFMADKVQLEVWKLKFRNKKLLVQYNDYEQRLFDLIKTKGKITLDDFRAECKMSEYLAVKILAKLVAVRAIDMIITEKESFYTIYANV